MAVETIGIPGEQNGYKDSMREFVQAHENNTRALLNIAEGKDKNDARPPHDDDHPDNQWPLMVHHPAKGELTVGKNLKGLTGPERSRTEAANKKALEDALNQGYRKEPYPKPQIAVLDPATEKAQLVQRNNILEGMLVSMQDVVNKLSTRLEMLEKGAPPAEQEKPRR